MGIGPVVNTLARLSSRVLGHNPEEEDPLSHVGAAVASMGI